MHELMHCQLLLSNEHEKRNTTNRINLWKKSFFEQGVGDDEK